MRNSKGSKESSGAPSFAPSRKVPKRGRPRRIVLLALAAFATTLANCASQPGQPNLTQRAQPAVAVHSATPESNARLDKLWQERLTERQDFPIGVGDLLEISISNVKELQDRTVRVDGNGDILLPLIGSLHVAGLTEPQISGRLADVLHKYVYHPEINLMVKTYSSREVGVMGAVRNPGLYALNGPDDTIHDLIERAGGPSDNAAREVLLSPAQPGANGGAALVRQGAPGTAMGKPPQPLVAAGGAIDDPDPEVPGGVTNTAFENDHLPWAGQASPNDFDGNAADMISLDSGGSGRQYANLPMRPGDTLFIPEAGQVSVVGWVYHPSVIPVRPGLTALGAVSAAGGMMYASDPSSVRILRREAGDQTRVIHVDLAAVQQNEAPDVALEGNDVVDVGYSSLKIPGYAFYYAVQGIVSFAPAAALMSGL